MLDIGCGWGGLALTLARDYGARVTGITLSTEQLAEAQARAAQEGLADRVKFELLDYRAMHRRFDRHRLGRHVRACRHWPLRRFLQYGAALPHV